MAEERQNGAQSERVLAVLFERAKGTRGWVKNTTDADVAAALPDIDRHALHESMHALRRAGMLSFTEHKIGDRKDFAGFRLTRKALATARRMEQPVVEPAPEGTDVEPEVEAAVEREQPVVEPAPERVPGTLAREDLLTLTEQRFAELFPLIEQVRRRHDRMIEAAGLLEQVGEDTLALAVLGRADSEDLNTPLQREIIAMAELFIGGLVADPRTD